MLPREFTRVEYIESTGSQYVDTGVKPNQDTRVVVVSTLSGAADSGGTAIFGSRTGAGNKEFSVFYMPTQMFYGYANAYQFANWAYGSAKMTIDANKNVVLFTDGTHELTVNMAYSAFTTVSPLYLFTCINNGTPYTGATAFHGKVDQAQIYSNGTQVRDYIPFINESGDANLWDDINHAAANKTGTFLYGPAIIPDAPANLAQTTTEGTVALTWDASDEYANHYKIIRDGTELADVDGDIFAYIDTTAKAGGAHTYKVIACNGTQDGGAASITVQLPLLIPQILAALITPNPAEINSKITITVTVSEIEKILEPTYFYSGEIYAGEV